MNKEDYLKEMMELKSGNISAFSKYIGIPYTTIRSILERGIENAKVQNIIDICDGLGITPESLVNFEDSVISKTSKIMIQLDKAKQQKIYNFAEFQLSNQNDTHILSGRSTAAGAPIDGDYEDVQQEIIVRNEVPRGADEVVTIAGDSMEPLLKQGSQAFVHYQPVPDNDGQIVIVSIKGDGVTCKRIYREDGKIRLKSINEKYEDMVFPAEDIRIIGKIIIDQKK